MPSLSKGIQISNITNSNLVVTGLVLLIVVALFFLPELVSFQDPEEERVASIQEEYVEEELEQVEIEEVVESTSDSPLGDIARKLDEKFRQDKEPSEALDIDKVIGSEEEFGMVDEFRAALRGKQWVREQKKLEKAEFDIDSLPSLDQLTWQMLRKKPMKKVLKQAQKEAIAIANSLENTKVMSRYALQNYIAGLGDIIKGQGKILDPKELPKYFDRLDKEVTASFLEEEVDRGDFMKWSEISLGPVLQTTFSIDAKKVALKPFRPTITLSDVSVIQPADRYGRWNPKAKVYVELEGIIEGKDVKHLDLYRNGIYVRRLNMRNIWEKGQKRKKVKVTTQRKFRIVRDKRAKNSIYTFVATDALGNIFERSYKFYPRVRKFEWNSPYHRGYAIPYAKYDPRLDRFFATRYSVMTHRASAENALYVKF